MAVLTGVKSIAINEAKTRALNFLTQDVKHHTHLQRPSAFSQGTVIVFYSPALVDGSLTVDLEIVFDTFSQEVFTTISSILGAAAGVPIFLAQSVYLLAAGGVAKLAGAAGEKLFDGRPSFAVSEPINIHWPGSPEARAGALLLTSGDVDSEDPGFRHKYQIDPASCQVVDKDQVPYTGDIPYVVISLDGTEQPTLKDFAPAAASSAVLNRFLHIRDGQSSAGEPVIEALKLYNDVVYRREVDRLNKEIGAMPDSTDKDGKVKLRDSYLKNIVSDDMKPPQA